jgi:hypothetical protein
VILVIASPGDDHAREVVPRCGRAGRRPLVLDTSRYPLDMNVRHRFGSATGPAAAIEFDGRLLDLSTVGVVWWRRPGSFTLDPALDADVATFAYSECAEAVDGLWASLDAAWVNPVAADATAHHKPYQLTVADRVGLAIPRTLMTNDAEAARHFVSEVGLGKVVYKTFLATRAHWRETRLLRREELTLLEHLRHAPAIFQERIDAVADVRVTVVGDELFATEITTSPGTYELDYRMALGSARLRATSVSDETEGAIRALMSELGLVYGAIDLLRTTDGAEVFLEINPAGEWLFAQARTGQDISGAMAALLGRLDDGTAAATVAGAGQEAGA